MIPPLRILCLGGVALALYYLLGAILGAVGRPDLSARGAYVFLAALLLPLYPAVRILGLQGTAAAVVLAGVAACCYLLAVSLRLVRCRASQVLLAIAFPVLIAGRAVTDHRPIAQS